MCLSLFTSDLEPAIPGKLPRANQPNPFTPPQSSNANVDILVPMTHQLIEDDRAFALEIQQDPTLRGKARQHVGSFARVLRGIDLGLRLSMLINPSTFRSPQRAKGAGDSGRPRAYCLRGTGRRVLDRQDGAGQSEPLSPIPLDPKA